MYHKAQFWAHYFSWYTLMILLMCLQRLSLCFFADDSNSFILGNDPDKLVTSMNEEMTKIIEWLRTNRLLLNIEKTHFMLFRKWKQKITFNNEPLIDDKKVEQVEKNKIFRSICWLIATWQGHIQYIEGKIARAFGVICKARKVSMQLL